MFYYNAIFTICEHYDILALDTHICLLFWAMILLHVFKIDKNQSLAEPPSLHNISLCLIKAFSLDETTTKLIHQVDGMTQDKEKLFVVRQK